VRLIGEGAVVVLSILIAFGVDAWWEYFGERVREQEAIEQLVDEFVEVDAELAELDSAYTKSNSGEQRLRQLMTVMGSRRGDFADLVLDSLIAGAIANPRVALPEGVLASLLASGDLSVTRRIRYSVAMSLDGFIATEDGGYDWIPMDDEIDFAAYLAKIGTLLMGRGTYEVVLAQDDPWASFPGMDVVVVSTTLHATDHPDATIINDDVVTAVTALKNQPGRDIWLFGGGVLFRSLLEAGSVDRVEIGVIPKILGQGIPLVPGLANIARLELHSSELFPKSGIALLKYDVMDSDRTLAEG
jgi:dihydrofolate reductase